MHWDGYTVFSVITGVMLLVVGLALPGASTKSRIYAVAGGAFFVVYGIYVANQTSGTYYFPVYIFVLPIAIVIGLVIKFYGANRTQRASSATSTGRGQVQAQSVVRPYTAGDEPPHPAAPRMAPKRTPVVVPEHGVLAAPAMRGGCGHDVRPGARFCTVCGRAATETRRPAMAGGRSATGDEMTDPPTPWQPRNAVSSSPQLRPRHARPVAEPALRLQPPTTEAAFRGEPPAVRPGRHARR